MIAPRREIPGWVVLPLVLLVGGGGYVGYERWRRNADTGSGRPPARLEALRRGMEGVPAAEVGERLDAILAERPADDEERELVEQNLENLLAETVRRRDPTTAEAVLRRLAPESKGRSMGQLGIAVRTDDLATLRVLLAGGVPARTPDGRPIRPDAVKGADVALRQAGIGVDPLADAISYRRTEGLRLLLEAGADPDRRFPLNEDQIAAIAAGRQTLPERATSAGAKRVECTPRSVAARCDDPAILALFPPKGPDRPPRTAGAR